LKGDGVDRVTFNHVGLCVSDRARSRAFYEGALDFEFWWELEPPDEGTSQLLQLPPPLGLHATYLVRDGFVLELLDYSARELEPGRTRVMAEPGLTHMSLSVDDMDGALARVAELGGSVIQATVGEHATMVRDPDGQLIELLGTGWRANLPPLPG
jgi:lactoylglutathione lyase